MYLGEICLFKIFSTTLSRYVVYDYKADFILTIMTIVAQVSDVIHEPFVFDRRLSLRGLRSGMKVSNNILSLRKLEQYLSDNYFLLNSINAFSRGID